MKQQFGIRVLCALLAWPAASFAYCRTTTCAQSNPPDECKPGQIISGCQMSGQELHWTNSCVSFSVQKDGSDAAHSNITADQLEEVVRTSFDNWQNAPCAEGGTPNITVKTYPQVECSEARYNQNDGNQNVWLFRDKDWPHQGGGDGTIALTLVSFSPKTGEIYDVDVELNSFNRHFSLETPTPENSDDLLSVVQHESGHFLGLAHSSEFEATMWANYSGSVDMRTLDADDIAGICAVFPPVTAKDTTCNADPRHGFSTRCSTPDDGCSITRSYRSTTSRTAWLLSLAAAMLLVRRASRWLGRGRSQRL